MLPGCYRLRRKRIARLSPSLSSARLPSVHTGDLVILVQCAHTPDGAAVPLCLRLRLRLRLCLCLCLCLCSGAVRAQLTDTKGAALGWVTFDPQVPLPLPLPLPLLLPLPLSSFSFSLSFSHSVCLGPDLAMCRRWPPSHSHSLRQRASHRERRGQRGCGRRRPFAAPRARTYTRTHRGTERVARAHTERVARAHTERVARAQRERVARAHTGGERGNES